LYLLILLLQWRWCDDVVVVLRTVSLAHELRVVRHILLVESLQTYKVEKVGVEI
jgi:hypothetical protein